MTEEQHLLLEEALRELDQFARDPHRDRLLNKFICPESHQMSELLGASLGLEPGYSPRRTRGASLPAPAGLVHPG
jgi:hypothetical protein